MVPFVSKQTAKGWLWAVVIGILALWQFHIPQFASKFDTFPGDRGDARLVAYLMEHWYQFFRGAEHWSSPGMFYPVPGTLGYADLLLGYGIIHTLLRTLGLGIFEAAEFTIIICNFLNYLVCFVLLNKVLRFNLTASIAGAVFFAFNGPKLMELGHTQLQPVFFLPLATIAIVLFVQHRATLSRIQAFGLIALAAASLTLQLLTGFYAAWFFIFWSSLFLVLTLLFTDTRRVVLQSILKFWPAFLGSLVVVAIGLIPFLKAYLPVLKLNGARDYKQVFYFIPRPVSFLLTSQRNYVWGSTTKEILERVKGIDPELQIGIGLVPTLAWIALVIFALWLVIRNFKARPEFSTEKRTNLLFLAQVIIATGLVYVIGVKYSEGFSPWQYIFSWFPGGQAIRAVARYAMIMAFPMAIAFAWLIDHLSKKIGQQQLRGRRALLLAMLYVLTIFGLGEQFARKEGFNGFSIKDENLYLTRLSHDLPANCSSFYVTVGPTAPHNEFEYQLDAALVSAMRNVPTLNGYSGYLPPTWDLWAVKDTVAYESNVKRWIADHQLPGNVCRLPIDEVAGPDFVDINKPEVFVRQLYIDVLGRLPDPTGFQMWTTMLQQCPNLGGPASDPKCDRIHVSQELLNSAEFVERSDFVLRLYAATLGREPRYEEFVSDRTPIANSPPPEVQGRKQQLIADFVQRPEFKSLYDGLANGAFVDKLLHTATNSPTSRNALVAALDSKQKTRADVILAVVEDQQTIDAFRNQGFVLMQFFAYLSRDPKSGEYEERVDTLKTTSNYRQLIFDFIYSVEYRKRFGYLN